MKRFGVAALLLVAAAARAEIPRELAYRQPPELARDAFDSPYGMLLVGELAKAVRENADPACLLEHSLDAAALDSEARELLVRGGTQLLETVSGLTDAAKVREEFKARAGDGGARELAELRRDPDVREAIAISDVGTLARIAGHITETIDRHLLLAGVRLARRISPLASGDAALLRANPEGRSSAALERYFAGHDSMRLRRWIELEEALQQAIRAGLNLDGFVRLGPIQLTPTAAGDAAKLCVFPKPGTK